MEPLFERLRRLDYDRWLSLLYAPPGKQEALLALYAFHLEVARVREVVSTSLLGEIRLTWWQEALDEIYGAGPVRKHEVALPLATAIWAHELPRVLFDRLISARLADLESDRPATLAQAAANAREMNGPLIALATRILGVPLDEAADAAGEAAGLTGLFRGLAFWGAKGRVLLPADLLPDPDPVLQGLVTPDLMAALSQVADAAKEAGSRARRTPIPRQARPAFLDLALAPLYLRLADKADDPFRSEMAPPSWRKQLRYAWVSMSGRF